MANVALPGQKYHAKGRRKETKIQKFMYRDTTSVEHDMCDRTGNNCSHRNGNKRFKKHPVKHSKYSLQKTVVLVTSHIIRKVLQSET